ncbi:TPA: glucosyltransferase domain-containing protein [Escherichia coli]
MNRYLLTTLLLTLFVSVPLVSINAQYLDDIARTVDGYYGWSIDGRPLADLIYYILSHGGRIVDLYPITQIISYMLVGVSSYTLCRHFGLSGAHAVLISIPAFASPLLLGNMLFRYDSINMSLSILSAVVAFVTSSNENKYYRLISVPLITSSMCLYQASVGIFVSATIACCALTLMSDEFKRACSIALTRAIYFVCGFICYKIISIQFGISGGAKLKSEFIEFNLSGLSMFTESSVRSMQLVLSAIGSGFFFVLTCLLLLTIFAWFVRIKNTKYKFIKSFYILVLLILLYATSFIFVSIVKNPPIIARSFISFGFIISMVLILISSSLGRVVSSALSIALSIFFIGLNSNIVKSVAETQELQNDIAKIIALKLNESSTAVDVTINGWLKTREPTRLRTIENPIIRSINWTYFDNQFAPYIITYSGYKIARSSKESRALINSNSSKWEVVYTSNVFTLYKFNNHAIVELHS